MYGFRCIASGQWVMVTSSRSATSYANVALTGVSTHLGNEIGFRGIPQVVKNANYTFVASDAGKAYIKNDTNAYSYTVNTPIHSAGDVLTIVNNSASGSITLVQGAGMVLRLAGPGTTGSRTIAPFGIVTIYFMSPSGAYVTGSGVS